tara:strand:- start:1102 stop:1302 length:201 start_codon:yes stop_codon:yes gene_type:complete
MLPDGRNHNNQKRKRRGRINAAAFLSLYAVMVYVLFAAIIHDCRNPVWPGFRFVSKIRIDMILQSS